MKLFKAFATVSFFTLISRLVGFARDIILAATLGSGILAEVFFVALRVPNFFRSLFAEGAFNAAFVPLFARKLKKEGEENARIFAGHIVIWLFSAVLLFTLVAQLLMPWLLLLLAPGFKENASQYELAVTLSRTTFPYLLFISLVALLGGMLNSFGKFAAVAVTPVILNICLIVSIPLLAPFTPTPAHALSWGVFIAGILQFLWLFLQLLSARKTPKLQSVRDVKGKAARTRFLRKLTPGIIGAGVVQLSVWLDTIIASFITGAVAYLYYADRLYQLPLALIGSAMGVVLLPKLTSAVSVKNNDEINSLNNNAVVTVLLFSLPAMAGMMLLAKPMISTLFERGAFDALSTQGAALALICYAPALPGLVLNKIAINNFFARGDTKTPVKLAGITLLIKLIAALMLLWIFTTTHFPRYLSLPLSTSIAAWSYVYLTYRSLAALNIRIMNKETIQKSIFLGVITLIMAVVVWSVAIGMSSWLYHHVFWIKACSLAFLIALAAVFYFMALHFSRIMPLDAWRKMLQK